VTLLEGRSRIGGRLYTNTTAVGAPVDLGAGWIHVEYGRAIHRVAYLVDDALLQGIIGNPIYALATSANISTVMTSYDFTHWYNGPSVINTPGVASAVAAAQADRIHEMQDLIYTAIVDSGPRSPLTLTCVHRYRTASIMHL